ncbi:hypothetical protein G7Z17_g3186 [Cylindrodendrum hubeiense]|uniref:Uncharacterized protein n=1 Tax=Cylindrodendrum hubeiense TaxID=595255 RepID=A0A9P5HGD1_9HYPO|nr:hypothetical protein G7Z17_g3186 [Cylindrodendrum hubeiense]
MDITRSNRSNPSILQKEKIKLHGHNASAGHTNIILIFELYYEFDDQPDTPNSTDRDLSNGTVSFDGHLNTRLMSHIVKFRATFPVENDHADNSRFAKNGTEHQIELSSDTIFYGSSINGGKVTIGTSISFGPNIDFFFHQAGIRRPTAKCSTYKKRCPLARND